MKYYIFFLPLLVLSIISTACIGDLTTAREKVFYDERVIHYLQDFTEDIEGAVFDNTAIVEGINGNALELEGYQSALSLPDSDDLTLAVEGTVEVWIYAYSLPQTAGILHKGGSNDFSDEAYGLHIVKEKVSDDDASLVFFLVDDYGAEVTAQSITKIAANEWYHVVATWNSDTVDLYLNGILENSIANTLATVFDSDGPLVLGAVINEPYSPVFEGYYSWHGIIDEVYILDAYIGEEEVLERYQVQGN